MRTQRTFARVALAAAIVGAAIAAHAQLYIPFPFPPSVPFASNFENFDAIPPGSYPSFPAMGGAAAVARIGAGGLLVIDNSILPAMTPPNCMWGRGVDVRWRFATKKRFFGGYFRVPSVGLVVTAMTLKFYNGVTPVGAAVVPVNMAVWTWRGWYVAAQFDRVEIFGNASVPGYVGMENIRVRN